MKYSEGTSTLIPPYFGRVVVPYLSIPSLLEITLRAAMGFIHFHIIRILSTLQIIDRYQRVYLRSAISQISCQI